MNIKITKRDLKLIQGLSSYGMLTTQQIIKLWFQGIQTRTALRRLGKLHKAKILRKNNMLPQGKCVWMLGKQGQLMTGHSPHVKRLNYQAVLHDLQVNDVRIALELNHYGSGWMMSDDFRRIHAVGINPNKRRPDTIPDVLFHAKTFNQKQATVALEVELNAKSIRRYETIFSKYSFKDNLSYLWYVVPTHNFGKRLETIWHEYFTRQRAMQFLWSTVYDVCNHTKHCKLYHRNHVFELGKFFIPVDPEQNLGSKQSEKDHYLDINQARAHADRGAVGVGTLLKDKYDQQRSKYSITQRKMPLDDEIIQQRGHHTRRRQTQMRGKETQQSIKIFPA